MHLLCGIVSSFISAASTDLSKYSIDAVAPALAVAAAETASLGASLDKERTRNIKLSSDYASLLRNYEEVGDELSTKITESKILREEIDRIQKEHVSNVAIRETKHSERLREIEANCSRKIRGLEAVVEEKNNEIDEGKRTLEALAQSCRMEVAKIKSECLEKTRQEVEQVEAKYTQLLEKCKEEHTAAIKALGEAHDEAIQAELDRHTTMVAELKEAQKNAQQEARRVLNEYMAASETRAKEERERLVEAHVIELEAKEEDLKLQREETEKKLLELKNSLESVQQTLTETKQAHADKEAELTKMYSQSLLDAQLLQVRQLEVAKHEYEEEVKSLKALSEAKEAELSAQFASQKRSLELKLQENQRLWENEKVTLAEKHQKEMNDVKSKHENEVKGLKLQYDKAKAEAVLELKNKHAEERKQLLASISSERTEWTASKREGLERISSLHEAEIKSMIGKHQSHIDGLTIEHKMALDAQARAHKQALQMQIEAAQKEKENDLASLREALQKARSELNEEKIKNVGMSAQAIKQLQDDLDAARRDANEARALLVLERSKYEASIDYFASPRNKTRSGNVRNSATPTETQVTTSSPTGIAGTSSTISDSNNAGNVDKDDNNSSSSSSADSDESSPSNSSSHSSTQLLVNNNATNDDA